MGSVPRLGAQRSGRPHHIGSGGFDHKHMRYGSDSSRACGLKPPRNQSEEVLLTTGANQLGDGRCDAAATRMLLHCGLVAAFLGLFAAAVLSIAHVLKIPVPCGGSSGCLTVAEHPSAKVLGVPIAFFGVGFFLAQIGLLIQPSAHRRARILSVGLAAAGVAISAVLLIYAQRVIGATCAWCIASACAMVAILVAGVSILCARPVTWSPRPRMIWALGFLTAVAIGAQTAYMQRIALIPPVPAERLARVPVAELLEPGKTLGQPTAAVTVIVFADFLCPSCKSELGSLVKYQQEHPNAVRLVYRHLPLAEIRGHEFSRAAAALSEIAAEQGKFWQFVEAVHRARTLLKREDYLAIMQRLGFDAAVVEARLNDSSDVAITRVRRDIALAEQLEINATPSFILQVSTHAPISANQRTISRILNSTEVVSLLAKRHQAATLR